MPNGTLVHASRRIFQEVDVLWPLSFELGSVTYASRCKAKGILWKTNAVCPESCKPRTYLVLLPESTEPSVLQ